MSNFQELHPPLHIRPKFFHPVDLGRLISNKLRTSPPPPSQPLLQQTMEQKQNKTKTKAKRSHITSHCLIQPTNNAIVSLKDGFTI